MLLNQYPQGTCFPLKFSLGDECCYKVVFKNLPFDFLDLHLLLSQRPSPKFSAYSTDSLTKTRKESQSWLATDKY